jgi:hypothetical protein
MRISRSMMGLSILLLLASCSRSAMPDEKPFAAATEPSVVVKDNGDDPFLEDLEHRSFSFFWDRADPTTGLIADRARADGVELKSFASIASDGFGLTGICIADQRGWIAHQQAYDRTLLTLRFFRDQVPGVHGFYYHFLEMESGKRIGTTELSSIDTAILMAGVLTARAHFPNTEVAKIATELYARVDWPWMLNGGESLAMGWSPEAGFQSYRWSQFCELPLLYLLGMGSPTHPLPASAWESWRRLPVEKYAGYTYVQCPPLFVHQYPQAWFDLRNTRDAHMDFWKNSSFATLAQRQFCMDLAAKFPGYGPNVWGISASDGPEHYMGWGGPPATTGQQAIDGTVVPCAAGGSIPFAPQMCIAALRQMKEQFGSTIWKQYGFVDSFNPTTGWADQDVIGIDVGITLLMAENQRSGQVWREFMSDPEMSGAVASAGFVATGDATGNDRQYLRGVAADTWRCIAELADPETGMPYDKEGKPEFTSVSNIGLYLSSMCAAREMGLIADEDAQRRIDRTLTSLEKLKTWHGFQQSWNSVVALEPSKSDTAVSALDSANLEASLIACAHAEPMFAGRIKKLCDAMDWSFFCDRDGQQLFGGLDTSTEKLNPKWHLDTLGTDAELAQFLAVASGAAKPDIWEHLNRSIETRGAASYLKPGWQGGGLFMQYISGIWLDNRDTLMGRSAENFAYAQIQHAVQEKLPVWGWSAAEAPDGKYLGWGAIKDQIVAPHASVLAIEDFPVEVVKNLKQLEAMGSRSADRGFYDSIDISTGQHSQQFLLLDQAMLFLSLANYLHHNVVRDWFGSDAMVREGRREIVDFAEPAFRNSSIFDLADGGQKALRRVAHAVRFTTWPAADWTVLDSSHHLESGRPVPDNQTEGRFAFAWDDDFLRFQIDVRQDQVNNSETGADLYKGDSVELYIDPENHGLIWGDDRCFQFGFSVPDKQWEWFGPGRRVEATIDRMKSGYRIEAKIPWSMLKLKPEKGMAIGVSPAVTSVGTRGGEPLKLNWSWKPEDGTIALGRLILE